jgi:hypothetical protein
MRVLFSLSSKSAFVCRAGGSTCSLLIECGVARCLRYLRTLQVDIIGSLRRSATGSSQSLVAVAMSARSLPVCAVPSPSRFERGRVSATGRVRLMLRVKQGPCLSRSSGHPCIRRRRNDTTDPGRRDQALNETRRRHTSPPSSRLDVPLLVMSSCVPRCVRRRVRRRDERCAF